MTEFVRACALSDLPAEGAIGLDIGDVPVAVIRAGGEVFALHDVCSHEEVPLSEGDIYDCTVECYLHGSCFDLRSGKPTGPPATKPVPTYRVKIEGDDVYVALGAGDHGADNHGAGDHGADNQPAGEQSG
jgi:3-phenylpropionate/trans-cinnamate dioxygenase ferredoxin subunit